MNRRERKKEETRENIINCAINLIKEKSFQATSMEEIAEKSDVSKGTLYNYFPDKESILVSYFQLIIADYGNRMKDSLTKNKDIKESLFDLLDFISGIFKSNKELALVYFNYRMPSHFDINTDSSKRSGIEKWLLEIMKNAQEKGQLRSDLPVLVLTRSFQFLAMSFVTSTINTDRPFEVDSFKNQLISLFLDGAKL